MQGLIGVVALRNRRKLIINLETHSNRTMGGKDNEGVLIYLSYFYSVVIFICALKPEWFHLDLK